jgi:hypothetical protein
MVCFLASLQGAVSQSSSQSTVRIELDPNATTVNGTCTSTFNANLAAQLSSWFTSGVASYNGAYPQDATPVAFNNTFRNTATGSRRLVQEEPSSGVVKGQKHRNLGCSKTTCTNCCPQACITYCGSGGGGCNFCHNDDDVRQLRGGDSRMLTATSSTATTSTVNNVWWAGNQTMQSSVAQSIQFSAQQWLSQNDPTHCMGNAWQLGVSVNYLTD